MVLYKMSVSDSGQAFGRRQSDLRNSHLHWTKGITLNFQNAS